MRNEEKSKAKRERSMSAEGRNALSEKIPLEIRPDAGTGRIHQLKERLKNVTDDGSARWESQLERVIQDPMPNETVRMEQSWMLVLLRALLSRH